MDRIRVINLSDKQEPLPVSNVLNLYRGIAKRCYVDTKTCRHCGSVFPATSEFFIVDKRQSCGLLAVCRICDRKRRREVYAKQPEKKLAYYYRNREEQLKKKKEYYRQNKIIFCENSKKWKSENKDKIAEYSKKYREKHKDEIAKRSYRYKQLNKEKIKLSRARYYIENKESQCKKTSAHAKANRDKYSTYTQQYRARKRSLRDTLTPEQWKFIVSSFNGKCAYCGKDRKLTREHFVPTTKGGHFELGNILPACGSCNSSKLNNDFNEWYPTYRHYSKEREEKILSFIQAHKS